MTKEYELVGWDDVPEGVQRDLEKAVKSARLPEGVRIVRDGEGDINSGDVVVSLGPTSKKRIQAFRQGARDYVPMDGNSERLAKKLSRK